MEESNSSGGVSSFMGQPLRINAIRRFSSCTNDGKCLYVYSESGLKKYGTGFGGTVAGALIKTCQPGPTKRRRKLQKKNKGETKDRTKERTKERNKNNFQGETKSETKTKRKEKGISQKDINLEKELKGELFDNDIFQSRRGWLCCCGQNESKRLYLTITDEPRELIQIQPDTLQILKRTPIDTTTATTTNINNINNINNSDEDDDDDDDDNCQSETKSCRKRNNTNNTAAIQKSDFIQKVKEAKEHCVVFTDGKLLYTLTPASASQADNDVLMSPPTSFSTPRGSPSLFNLDGNSSNRYAIGNNNNNNQIRSTSFATPSPFARTVDTKISDEANQGSKQGEHIPQMVDPIPRVRYIDPLELREELSSEPNYDLPPGLVDDPSTDPNMESHWETDDTPSSMDSLIRTDASSNEDILPPLIPVRRTRVLRPRDPIQMREAREAREKAEAEELTELIRRLRQNVHHPETSWGRADAQRLLTLRSRINARNETNLTNVIQMVRNSVQGGTQVEILTTNHDDLSDGYHDMPNLSGSSSSDEGKEEMPNLDDPVDDDLHSMPPSLVNGVAQNVVSGDDWISDDMPDLLANDDSDGNERKVDYSDMPDLVTVLVAPRTEIGSQRPPRTTVARAARAARAATRAATARQRRETIAIELRTRRNNQHHSTPATEESKLESVVRIESKEPDRMPHPVESEIDSKINVEKSKLKSKNRAAGMKAWRRGMVITAFNCNDFKQLGEYSLLVPPRIGFEIKARSKYYHKKTGGTSMPSSPQALARSSLSSSSSTCVIFCGLGAQRCRKGILRSWSLHSELPGIVMLCVWRRFSMNVVEKVAVFQTEVVKGIQTIHVPSTVVERGDVLGLIFPSQGAAAITYDDGHPHSAR